MFDFKKYLDMALKEDAMVLFKRVYDKFLKYKPYVLEEQIMQFAINGYNFILTSGTLIIKQIPLPGPTYVLSDIVVNGKLMSQHGKWEIKINKIESMKFEDSRLKIYLIHDSEPFLLELNLTKPEEINKIDELIGKHRIQLNILQQENNQAGK
jgi:hypothetical protein